MQTVQTPEPVPQAIGFNPFSLSPEQVGEGHGWHLLNEGDAIRPGDGYWHPDCEGWVSYECRPDIFRGGGNEGSWYHVPVKDYVHTWPWRRRTRANEKRNGKRK